MLIVETILPQPNHIIAFLKHGDETFKLAYVATCEGQEPHQSLRSEDFKAEILSETGWIWLANENVLAVAKFDTKDYQGKTFHQIALARAELHFEAAQSHLKMLYTHERYFS